VVEGGEEIKNRENFSLEKLPENSEEK